MSLVPVLQQEAPVPLMVACLLPRARPRDRPPSSSARYLHDLSEGRGQLVLTPAGERDALGVQDQRQSVKRNLGGVRPRHSCPSALPHSHSYTGVPWHLPLCDPCPPSHRGEAASGCLVGDPWYLGGGLAQREAQAACPSLWLWLQFELLGQKSGNTGPQSKAKYPGCTASPGRRERVREVWDALSESVSELGWMVTSPGDKSQGHPDGITRFSKSWPPHTL